jgi:ketosteroid isomerase-like protein
MTRDFGKYVHVWKRAPEGAWRIHVAIWNSNLPPAPMRR